MNITSFSSEYQSTKSIGNWVMAFIRCFPHFVDGHLRGIQKILGQLKWTWFRSTKECSQWTEILLKISNSLTINQRTENWPLQLDNLHKLSFPFLPNNYFEIHHKQNRWEMILLKLLQKYGKKSIRTPHPTDSPPEVQQFVIYYLNIILVSKQPSSHKIPSSHLAARPLLNF